MNRTLPELNTTQTYGTRTYRSFMCSLQRAVVTDIVLQMADASNHRCQKFEGRFSTSLGSNNNFSIFHGSRKHWRTSYKSSDNCMASLGTVSNITKWRNNGHRRKEQHMWWIILLQCLRQPASAQNLPWNHKNMSSLKTNPTSVLNTFYHHLKQLP